MSPAKALDYESPLPEAVPHTSPEFAKPAAELINVLRAYSPQQVAQLMHLSDPLSALNVARYAAWRPRFTASNSRQAVLAFNGDVYGGLQARSLSPAELDWLQAHLCILSGLYGVLRPLDWMQPYRLEMGTALKTDRGANLYEFWGDRLTAYFNRRLAAQTTPVLVNLASQEYFKAVQRKAIKARVIDCVFENEKDGQYKVIGIYAKRARGLMARYAAQHRITHPGGLEGFDLEGYALAPAVSTPERLVFRRKQ